MRINEKVWEGVMKAATMSMQLAMDHLQAWELVRNKPSHSRYDQVPSRNDRIAWKKPAANLLKCNTDAALFEQEGKYGICMCIRDENGSFMEHKTMWV